MNGAAWHSESRWHAVHANNHHTAPWHLPAILNAALDKLRWKRKWAKPLFCDMSQIIFMANAHVSLCWEGGGGGGGRDTKPHNSFIFKAAGSPSADYSSWRRVGQRLVRRSGDQRMGSGRWLTTRLLTRPFSFHSLYRATEDYSQFCSSQSDLFVWHNTHRHGKNTHDLTWQPGLACGGEPLLRF